MTLMAEELRSVPSLVSDQIGRSAHAYWRAGKALRSFDPKFVVTCARGSSDNAATYLNYICGLCLGLPVASIGPSVVSVYNRTLRLGGSVCISISQSGRSPDLVAFQNAAKEAKAATVALVNTVPSPLADGAAHVVDIRAGQERAVAATKSFVCSLTATAAIISAWAGNREVEDAVRNLPARLDAALDTDWYGAAANIGSADSLYTVGRGPGFAIAQEAALKFKETCQIHAESYSSAEVLHGPIQLAASGLSALVFLSRDEARDGMIEAVLRMAKSGVHVFVADPANEAAFTGYNVTRLPCVAAPHPLLDPICQIVSFYRLVEQLARSLGFDPDSPGLLKKVTETV